MGKERRFISMSAPLSKKMLIMNILDILRKYTDEDHRLSQKEIADILQSEYSMPADRKSIRRNLTNLMDFGYDIEYSESVRMIPVTDPGTGEKKLEENIILSDFFLRREFDDSELRLIIDSLLFAKHIPINQRKELIGKLEKLSSIYFKFKVKHIAGLTEHTNINPALFYTIEILNEAISKKRQVSFAYCEYGTDKKLHKRCRPDGSIREYIVNPYQMAAKEGKYYLICNYDKYNDISNYRIDRITDIKLLETPLKPFETLDWANNGTLDLSKYMAEHIYMYSSENVRVKFRIVRAMISDVIDVFGSDISFFDETDTHVTVSALVNEMAMMQFAKSYAPDVLVLSPPKMVDKIKKDLERSLHIYNER